MASASKESNVSLPVLQRPSYNRRRWTTLFVVQLLIVIHVVLWLLSQKYNWFGGKTITPIEPSEAMEFSKYGIINAGALLVILAFFVTLIFGRFFCGWACHFGAVQEFSWWVLNKCGIKQLENVNKDTIHNFDKVEQVDMPCFHNVILVNCT